MTQHYRENDSYGILRGRPVAIDLFSGVGGLSLGLEQAGFNVALDVEIEEIAGRYAQYNAPATRVLYGDALGDVRRFTAADVRETCPYLRGDVALVAGGPPCQGFSLAGKRSVDDPLNDLVREFARVVLDVKPLSFLMENVPGMTYGSNAHLDDAISRLTSRYDVTDPTSLLACDFGVPQARERVFLLGIRKDLRISPSLPIPTHVRPQRNRQQLLFNELQETPSVWQSISDIPEADRYPELIDADRVAYDKEPASVYEKIMRDEMIDIEDLSIRFDWDSSICTNLRRTQHGDQLIARFAKLGYAQSDKMSGIRRLDPDDVSTTIRAGTTKDRGAWSAPRPLHPFQPRVLTTRECARLQSFPDWFFFHPTKWHGNRQVGNAVPPLLARAIGRHLLRLLGIAAPPFEMIRAKRDISLIGHDIEHARTSRLSQRRVSQIVTHTRKRMIEI